MSKTYNEEVICIKTLYSFPGSRLLNYKGKVYGYWNVRRDNNAWPHKIETEKDSTYWVNEKSFVRHFKIVSKLIDFGINDEDFELI